MHAAHQAVFGHFSDMWVCAGHDPKVLLDTSAEEDFQAKMQEANFGTATSALTILRYCSIACVLVPELKSIAVNVTMVCM